MGKNVQRAGTIIRMKELSTGTISLLTERGEVMTGNVIDAIDGVVET